MDNEYSRFLEFRNFNIFNLCSILVYHEHNKGIYFRDYYPNFDEVEIMQINIRKLQTSIFAIFTFAVLFLFISFLFEISGIYGIFFAYSFPELGSFDVIGWVTTIVGWIVKLIIKLFMLGMLLSLLAWSSAYLANKMGR